MATDLSGPGDAGAGQALDARTPLDADQIERATYLVEACGGREWTAARAKANLDAALGALERVRLSASLTGTWRTSPSMSSSGTRDRSDNRSGRRPRRSERGVIGGRSRPPSEAAAPARVVEGGTGNQRHHGRGSPHAPLFPGDTRPGAGRSVGAVDPVQSTPRRDLEQPFSAAPRICPPPSRPTSPCASPATLADFPIPSRQAAEWVRNQRRDGSAAGSSPGSGSPSWAAGTGTTFPSFLRRSCTYHRGRRSTSTTSGVGPARPSWP